VEIRTKENSVKNIGVPELLIILAVVLLLFGARKLPDLARSLGSSAKEFREGLREGSEEEEEEQTKSSDG
jgi:sec-independent protein translocase protein TatA